jgi:hypothetical protein
VISDEGKGKRYVEEQAAQMIDLSAGVFSGRKAFPPRLMVPILIGTTQHEAHGKKFPRDV